MTVNLLKRSAATGALLAIAILATGCGKPAANSESAPVSEVAHADHDHDGDEHDHGGWWCAEHGVPEADCSMCSSTAAAAFKEKGDWCEEHNRAESQCFQCDPSRAVKFASLYEAKFGEQPPKPTE